MSPSSRVLVEICLDDLSGVGAAERAGADRIELCAALSEGGITPSIGTVAGALQAARRIDVNVLVRQRPGDFVYTAEEVEAMVADIRAMRSLPRADGVALGFVIGALAPDGTVDLPATARLAQACGEAPVTFHKAFDQVPDRIAALEQLVSLGVTRILTSGGAPSALDGAAELGELVRRAGDRVTILAGGGVRPANAAEVVRRTGVREVHLRAMEAVPSASSTASVYDTGTREVTSEAVVAAVVASVSEVAA
ncbi:copper homeostasis protein CutC [Leifsonia sp. F6_8S_P_1B]|uniref:PF03932 family protein CutC n=1 Tax=Leifsonia williamsii TaxID=3035919 RepID=A0ABT8K970_9MICO|nr:copper homeostasis protein CutC [Leifsonia williamsii]MDN4613998.1 copper homeostasis protein CutC [Leifsonia williamsii]